jgi:altered-inheritance-of-mitochondria protein 13
MESVRRQVDKYAERRKLAAGTTVEQSRKLVLECYKKNPDRPLECWKEAEEFRAQVASVENVSFHLHTRLSISLNL